MQVDEESPRGPRERVPSPTAPASPRSSSRPLNSALPSREGSRTRSLSPTPPSTPPSTEPVPSADGSAAGPLPTAEATYIWEFDVFDFYTLETRTSVQRQPDSTNPAVDLMAHGYIAKTPNKPQVAVSVRTLELLYRLRNRKASFSIEAFAKVMCDYYKVCPASCLRYASDA